MFQPSLLAFTKREDVIEDEFCGSISIFNEFGLLDGCGHNNSYKWLHELSDFAVATLLIDFETINFFNFSEDELVIMTSTHGASEEQIGILNSILAKINLSEKNLKCPNLNSFPDKNNGKILNPHSGVHCAMLALCIQNGWNIYNYFENSHPLQKTISKKIKQLAQVNFVQMAQGQSGCPIFALTCDDLAKMFINIFSDKKYDLISKSILNYPYIFGGSTSFDSELIYAGRKKIIAKSAYGGLFSAYNLLENQVLIIKLAQENQDALKHITYRTLCNIGWLHNNPTDENIYNQQGIPVGKYFYNFSFSH